MEKEKTFQIKEEKERDSERERERKVVQKWRILVCEDKMKKEKTTKW